MTVVNKTIVLGIQENYKVPASVLIKSILENNPNINFDIFILSDMDLFSDFSHFVSPCCRIHAKVININEIKNVDCGRFNIATLYRLLMDRYLPNDIGKVLYLDSDIVVNGSLDELFDIVLTGEQLVAAVECSISREHVKQLGMKENKIFNAGVILFDFKRCCEENIFEKTREYVVKHNTSFNDQDALNVVLEGRVKYIDASWNYEFFRAKRDLILNKVDAVNKKIIHFTGKNKPWDYGDINPYSYLYSKYYRSLYAQDVIVGSYSYGDKIKKKVKLFCYRNYIISACYMIVQYIFRTRTQ